MTRENSGKKLRGVLSPFAVLAMLTAVVPAIVQDGPTAAGIAAGGVPGRFDPLLVSDPSVVTQPETVSLQADRVPPDVRAGWARFFDAHGSRWNVVLDARSGAPVLAEGQGIPWIPGSGNSLRSSEPVTLDTLERSLRDFLALHASVLAARDEELVLDRDASGRLTPDLWQVVFRRAVSGVPVLGDRYVFMIGHGNLIAFGASRWGAVRAEAEPSIDRGAALSILLSYMDVERSQGASQTPAISGPSLVFVPLPETGSSSDAFDGVFGDGYGAALAWRIVVRVPGEPGTWVGLVGARDGAILAFFDEDLHARVKGGAYPESNDGLCPGGCEQAGLPLPWADVGVNGSSQTANGMGRFTCSPAFSSAVTTLAGPYARIVDACGALEERVTCDDDLDLLSGAGTNCAVPAPSSPGNTHAARSAFYHVNRIAEKARAYLPSNSWLNGQLAVKVNLSGACDASWSDGAINFHRAGTSPTEDVCRNTGEIAGIVQHEWGHGLDQNDGGGNDNPSEAYSDITEFLEDHTSCIGRGYFTLRACTGYGNACLDCTGVRDMDWDRRTDHAPSTAAGFVRTRCGVGSAPCGREPHCESYLAGETMWDLAVRDLPASGLDPASAWQLVQDLWYESRQGSGGNLYNCPLAGSNGCGTTTLFTRLRTADDDDGDLANGTPHAAAIFSAFNRHGIACGAAGDAANQSFSACPALAPVTPLAVPGTGSVSLSWQPVANAASYVVFRNDLGCDHSFTPIAEVTGTSFTDTGLPDGFTLHYRVRPAAANSACRGPMSACLSSAARPLAGRVRFSRPYFACSSAVTVIVEDANIGSATTSVEVGSTTEPGPQTVVLTQEALGSDRYVGTIQATAAAPSADGLLSLANGDTLTARYVDGDDGIGGTGLVRTASARADCVRPAIFDISVGEHTGANATVSWSTNEPADAVLTWGSAVPPLAETSQARIQTAHSIRLGGLQDCTAYWFAVRSTDPAGNKEVDDNAGRFHRFETWGSFGAGLQPCHSGQLAFDRPVYGCSDVIYVDVTDIDLDRSPGIETVTIDLTSTSETVPERLVLTETGGQRGKFRGSIPTAAGVPLPDGKIQVQNGDRIAASYRDDDDGSGRSVVSFAVTQLPADCTGPVISGVQTAEAGPGRIVVSWITDEPSNSRVDWGTTPALGNTVIDNAAVTSHALAVGGLSLCGTIYFRVRSEDERGYATVDDRGGALYGAQVSDIPGKVFFDSFETPTGWTLDGEWETGPGLALGTNFSDPWGAWSGSHVLGTDLSGLGAWPGDYEPNVDIQARSPVINASALANARLIFRRWLNVEGSSTDLARVWIKVGGKFNEVFRNSTQATTESAWSEQSIDVSSYADGKSSVQVVFGLTSNASLHRSGWNVDDVVVKDGSRPASAPCGGCAAAPSFAGLSAAVDADACADTGITLSWPQAAAWGSGGSGTYAIHRDVVPNFVATSGNRVASGLSTSSWTDATAPNGVALHYLARAENDETCSTGPNNGGVQDDNASYRQAVDTAAQAPAGDVGSSLRLGLVASTHVRLEWAAAAGAVEHRIYRATNPAMEAALLLGSTAGTYFEDLGEATENLVSRFYLVRGVDACGREGP